MPVVVETTAAPATIFAKYTTKALMTETEPVAMAPMKPFAAFDLSLTGFEHEKKLSPHTLTVMTMAELIA